MQRLTTANPSSGGQQAWRWFYHRFFLSDNFSPSGIDVSNDRWWAQWRLCGKIVFSLLFFRMVFYFFRCRAWWFEFRQWIFFRHNHGQQWRLWLCYRWVFRVDLRLLQGFLNPREKSGQAVRVSAEIYRWYNEICVFGDGKRYFASELVVRLRRIWQCRKLRFHEVNKFCFYRVFVGLKLFKIIKFR